MKKDFVRYGTEIYYIQDDSLSLKGIGINSFDDIENLENLTNLKHLEIEANNITEIKRLNKLTNLEELSLWNNNIEEIKGLDNLKKLKTLNLSSNKIKKITGLQNLIRLEKLLLHSNKINKIEGLDNLTRLKEIHLGKNLIKEIEGLDNLTNLITLDLRDNKIRRIKGLGKLNSLKELKISETDSLKFMIKKLGGMKGPCVDSPQNFIKFCRNEFVSVKGKYYFVKEGILNLENLGIERISEISGLENIENLERISLSNNEIIDLDFPNNLINLKILDLRSNKIEEIKSINNLRNLRSLYLSHNKIKEIKGLKNLNQLVVLALNGNNIKEIKGLDGLKAIKHLNLSINQINKISNLEHLDNLNELDLSINKIKIIENLNSITTLERLYLASNSLTEIERIEKLVNLKELNLQNNNIKKMNGIEKVINLEKLNLSENNITQIENLENLVNLEDLYLNDNSIEEIKGVENLSKLKNFHLDNNNIPENLFNALKLSDKTRNHILIISYCLLKTIINDLDSEIRYSDLIKDYPYLEKLEHNELKAILNQLKFIIVRIQNDNVISIVTPDYIASDLDELIEPRPYDDNIEYEFIAQNLSLEDKYSAKKLCSYIIKNNFSKFSLYETINGIRKTGPEQLRHNLVIYDTLNQTFFLGRNQYEIKIKELEEVFLRSKSPSINTFKFAFISNTIVRKNAHAIDYLKKSGWNLLYFLKEDKEDYDANLLTFIEELSKLCNKKWNRIFLISNDSDLVDHFIKNYSTSQNIELFILTQKENLNLKSHPNLELTKNHDLDINIFKIKM